jgi:hypothetical protein
MVATTRATRERRIFLAVMLVLVFGRIGVALISAGLTMSSVPPHQAPSISVPAPPTTIATPIVGRPGASLGIPVR